MRAVSDTGPLNYLVLIGDIGILPQLFGAVFIPTTVHRELAQLRTPAPVRAWIETPPPWLVMSPEPVSAHAAFAQLDAGERAAIALALQLGTEYVLMDERQGVAMARAQGLAVTGTLGLLQRAARRGLLDLASTFEKLRQTSFHARQELLDRLLVEDRAWRGTR